MSKPSNDGQRSSADGNLAEEKSAENKSAKNEGRRAALAPIAVTIATPFITGSAARAQAAWPNRPVRYINPFPAGGATDTLSRI